MPIILLESGHLPSLSIASAIATLKPEAKAIASPNARAEIDLLPVAKGGTNDSAAAGASFGGDGSGAVDAVVDAAGDASTATGKGTCAIADSAACAAAAAAEVAADSKAGALDVAVAKLIAAAFDLACSDLGKSSA